MATAAADDSSDIAESELGSGERTPLLASDSSTLSGRDIDQHKDALDVENNIKTETSTLGRQIGWSSAFILVISRVIGSGIYAMPGVVLSEVGSTGLALSLWVAGALVSYTGLAITIEYGAMFPRSGGVKVYLEETYRRPHLLATVLVAVHAVLLGFTASNCIIFAKYMLYAANIEPSDISTKLSAVGLLTLITIVHGCFYRTGVYVQNLLGWLKIGLTVFMIMTGFTVLARSKEPVPKWAEIWAGSTSDWNTISTAFFKILYSFAGLENVNNVMNEVKKPIRTIKTVGPAGLLTACLMYLLINISYLAVVPVDEVKQSRELIAALFFEKVGFGRSFLPIAIALSAAGNVMVVVFSTARFKQEIARSGVLPLPKILASNEPFNSPLGGLLIHYIPSVLVIVLPPSSTVYSFIADVEGYSGQFFGLAIAAGLLILRWKQPNLPRPYKAWLPVVWFRIALAICLIMAPLFPPKKRPEGMFYATYALLGIAVLIFGIAYWFATVIAWPRYRGYKLVEETEALRDGTKITKLVRRPLQNVSYATSSPHPVQHHEPLPNYGVLTDKSGIRPGGTIYTHDVEVL
ncbi:Low-affinity methionine permease [Cyphellophora attinorum]|uniref:Low-affinity methionine permease n=1 Tax=Cyphellophora attinorum TaxID=1664694 RepID=A0A0N1H709_9EURO|nr:Low-affinity methionine permease [Phialophora attinorum]KPI42035.1 Low-affinity methionine permease [Phialophora attinorum]